MGKVYLRKSDLCYLRLWALLSGLGRIPIAPLHQEEEEEEDGWLCLWGLEFMRATDKQSLHTG